MNGSPEYLGHFITKALCSQSYLKVFRRILAVLSLFCLCHSGRAFPKLPIRSAQRSARPSVIRAQWLENSAEVEVAAPLQQCWELWEDQERIPNWMPWISSVKVHNKYCAIDSCNKMCSASHHFTHQKTLIREVKFHSCAQECIPYA